MPQTPDATPYPHTITFPMRRYDVPRHDVVAREFFTRVGQARGHRRPTAHTVHQADAGFVLPDGLFHTYTHRAHPGERIRITDYSDRTVVETTRPFTYLPPCWE